MMFMQLCKHTRYGLIMKQALWMLFLILSFNVTEAQSDLILKSKLVKTTTISYRTQIANDTCRVFIRNIKSDSLVANIWLIRKQNKIWETTVNKKRFKSAFVRYQGRVYNPISPSYDNYWKFPTSKEMQSVKFENLVFESIDFDFIRSGRLYYKAIFTDKVTNQKFRVSTGILYSEEKKTKKEKVNFIEIFGILVKK